MTPGKQVQYRCSFCGKSQEQVHRLIAGPGGVYICDYCIELCQEIVTEEGSGETEPGVGWRAKAGGPARGEDADGTRDVASLVALLLEHYEERLLSIEERLAALEQKP